MVVRHSQDTVGMQRAGPVAVQLFREAQGTLCLKSLPTAASHRPHPELPTGKHREQSLGIKSLPDGQRLLNTRPGAARHGNRAGNLGTKHSSQPLPRGRETGGAGG